MDRKCAVCVYHAELADAVSNDAFILSEEVTYMVHWLFIVPELYWKRFMRIVREWFERF